MQTIEVRIERKSVVSSRPFEAVVQRLAAAVGHPERTEFRAAMAAATSIAELDAVVRVAIGPSGLMEFIRFDAGEVVRKGRGGTVPRMLRILVGNPVIMKQMAETVPDAAAYAPVTILIDERADGVHLSYDTMASLLAPYGSAAALQVAGELDAKIAALLEASAR